MQRGLLMAILQSCVVAHPTSMVWSKQAFDSLGVPVVTSHRFLGGSLGDVQTGQFLSRGKLISGSLIFIICHRWLPLSLKRLMLLLATKSLQCEWIYLQCVVSNYCPFFAPLENAMFSSFLSAMFGYKITPLNLNCFLPQCILVILEFSFLIIWLSLYMMLQHLLLIALWISFGNLLVLN